MIVHYLWIGSNKVPSSYFNNLNQCVKLNPTYDFMMWDDEKCLELLKEYKMVDYWNSLPTAISSLESLTNTSDLKTIKSGYSSIEAAYILSFSEDDIAYCFDMRGALQDGSARTTTWTNITPTAFCTTANRQFLIGKAGYVGLYNGYNDNGSTYRMVYYSSYFDFQQPTVSKILKKVEMLVLGAQNQDITLKWDFDFKKSYQSSTITVDPTTIAEYGIGEYNIGNYSLVLKLLSFLFCFFLARGASAHLYTLYPPWYPAIVSLLNIQPNSF